VIRFIRVFGDSDRRRPLKNSSQWRNIKGMEFEVIESNGTKVVEAIPDGASILLGPTILEAIAACWEHKTARLLVHAANLPARFFDLKSGEAGEILQKYRNYGVRLAVVGGLAEAAAYERFSEAMVEENRQPHFRIFAEREQAIAWLAGESGNPAG
jgi:hypothetical protein